MRVRIMQLRTQTTCAPRTNNARTVTQPHELVHINALLLPLEFRLSKPTQLAICLSCTHITWTPFHSRNAYITDTWGGESSQLACLMLLYA